MLLTSEYRCLQHNQTICMNKKTICKRVTYIITSIRPYFPFILNSWYISIQSYINKFYVVICLLFLFFIWYWLIIFSFRYMLWLVRYNDESSYMISKELKELLSFKDVIMNMLIVNIYIINALNIQPIYMVIIVMNKSHKVQNQKQL